MKRNRVVTYTNRNNEFRRQSKSVPMVRLTGNYLARLGFDIGQPIEVEFGDGKIEIRAKASRRVDGEASPMI